jgi:LysM domain
MGSLTAHLRETDDHGRLRFHPNCPVCRQERLYGTLSSEPIVSRRAQALLAGGVLAVSSSAPAVTIAQEPDRQSEGVAAPEALGGPELDDPSFDPGGDTALSFDTAPAPAAPEGGEDSGAGAPLDVEPTVDLDAGLAPVEEPGAPVAETPAPPTDEEAGTPPVGSVPPVGPQPPATAPPTPPVEPPAQLGDEATTPPVETPDARENVRSKADRPASPPRVDDEAGPPADGRRAVTPPAPSVPPAAAPPAAAAPSLPATPSAPSSPAAEPVAVAEVDVAPPADSPKPLDRNARFYVVQPGDSLWSIAKRLVGPDASPARVARAVNRLWSVNRDQIATGDPDLLMVGTRLDLR